MDKWYRVRVRARVRDRTRAREHSSSFLFFLFFHAYVRLRGDHVAKLVSLHSDHVSL